MKYFATVFLILSTTFFTYSQTYEIGGLIGGANYIGDVGKTNFINPNTLAIGGLVKWNRSTRHAFRGSLMVAKIEGDDLKSNNSRRNQRGYSFQNTIKEISLGLEYTFWEFNVHSQRSISTPYLYTGLTYFWYDALYKRGDIITEYDKAGSVAIPMVVGYKANIGVNAMVGFEIGARYTFTDNLDGSNPVKDLADDQSLKFGNTNSDDWYVFTGITVTFAFGRKPCYCNF
ncbi:MAG: hypothetical protein CL526_05525 [Aequorivita sp.]|nr:hypothetical protein [Aequorivita sp.]|tara:strand:- start:10427 stop:11116 length:690 start_codon:yes stop_codon:yes gene_type:complete